MKATSTFKSIMSNKEKIENINLKEFMKTGTINIKLKNLTDQEKEDLSHLRINNINGALFDDME